MAAVTDVTIAVGATPILPQAGGNSLPSTLINIGANTMTLTFGGGGDTYALVAGASITVSSDQTVTGTVAAATEPLQILVGITL